MAGSVIQATGMMESSLEAAGALVVAAPILGLIPNPSRGAGWSWVGCGCHKDPISDQISILPSSVHGWY